MFDTHTGVQRACVAAPLPPTLAPPCRPPRHGPTRTQVTVQAGARVQAVADELRKHGLTLQNYASIREQTIGGFTQVSEAAGAGAGGGNGGGQALRGFEAKQPRAVFL